MAKKLAAKADVSFDPREMMEMAIKAMRLSVFETREDTKASPLVGAVIIKPDGSIESAHRGELRDGDHAEYALLERKNRASKLDGAVLFATLEPCAPGARHSPKLSCAERIVLARIKKVWVGIEDPDPTVDRKGIMYLQEKGVVVEMFDRDLQDTIRSANKDYIVKAVERNTTEKMAKPSTLSELEKSISTVNTADLSTEALERYRSIAKISDAVSSKPFNLRLLQQGLLKKEAGGNLRPTGFGFLLFGSNPRNVMPQAGLLGTFHNPNGEVEIQDFDGPTVLIPELVQTWLKAKLPDTLDRGQMRRRQGPDLELIREAVVNALVHRDYALTGAKCQLIITQDTITVMSPGGPVAPITLSQLQAFDAPMLSRNPQLHYVFARMELAEERGLGMKSLRSRPEALGLPLPKFTFENPYLTLTLYRSSESAVQTLPSTVLKTLNKDERAGWKFLSSKTSATMAEYAKHMGFDARKAQRHMKQFVEVGLLLRIGRGPATEYKLRSSPLSAASATSSSQPKTKFQEFNGFLDGKIAQANGIKRDIKSENKNSQIELLSDWIGKVSKALHIAFGGESRNDFVSYEKFLPQILHRETVDGLKASIGARVAYLERLKKDRTAANLLSDFNPIDLKDYE